MIHINIHFKHIFIYVKSCQIRDPYGTSDITELNAVNIQGSHWDWKNGRAFSS